MTDLTHLNAQGEAQMVDIAGKLATSRTAVAQAEVSMLPSIVSTLSQLPKGDALACARIAGIMAAVIAALGVVALLSVVLRI